jgi:acyl-coenzyme A synthetase/AMP-(fatty) acid ligase
MIEYLVRKQVQKSYPIVQPISQLGQKNRAKWDIISYEGANVTTQDDLLRMVANLQAVIATIEQKEVFLYCHNSVQFLATLIALLQAKKEVLLSANISPSYLKELSTNYSELPPLFTDQTFDQSLENPLFFIPSLLKTDKVSSHFSLKIESKESFITFFTSGSSGKPKAVLHSLKQLEDESLLLLQFMIRSWPNFFKTKRHLYSTVNHHHLYGFSFAILLPFTAGIPFKENRLETIEELEAIPKQEEIVLITVPAFLKRAVQYEKNFELNNPLLFSSGGKLETALAQQTAKIFTMTNGPIEFYGSTETGAVSYRSAVTQEQFKALPCITLNLNHSGCLTVQSPMVEGQFETADLATLSGDGEFTLQGREDSIVKLEEKRVSLLEMEERLLASNLVDEVKVILLSGVREHLGVVMVLKPKGLKHFEHFEKRAINDYWYSYLRPFFEAQVIPKKWRYVPSIPVNSQGKRDKNLLISLFYNHKEE